MARGTSETTSYERVAIGSLVTYATLLFTAKSTFASAKSCGHVCCAVFMVAVPIGEDQGENPERRQKRSGLRDLTRLLACILRSDSMAGSIACAALCCNHLSHDVAGRCKGGSLWDEASLERSNTRVMSCKATNQHSEPWEEPPS